MLIFKKKSEQKANLEISFKSNNSHLFYVTGGEWSLKRVLKNVSKISQVSQSNCVSHSKLLAVLNICIAVLVKSRKIGKTRPPQEKMSLSRIYLSFTTP